MKKNEKSLHFFLKKMAGDQILIIGIWLVFIALLLLVAGFSLNFILGKIILSITSSSIGVAILKNTWWIILIICVIVFFYFTFKTIYKSRKIIPERHVALLECFSEFVGKDTDKIEDSIGVIHEGLHFVFPYFNIFKIHNDVAYFLGNMEIELFEGIDKEKDFLIDVKDTSVNLAATVRIKIFNPIYAAYNVDDYQKLIVDKCEAALRKRCVQYDLKGLLENKKNLTLQSIFDDLNADNKSVEIKKIEEDFGVGVLEFIVTDIGVQKKDLEEREKILKAENEKKVAEIENAKMIEKAKKDAEELNIKTKAETKRIEDLSKAEAKRLITINAATAKNLETLTGAEADALKNFLKETGLTTEEFLKKEWIDGPGSNAKNTFIFGDSNGIASLGAQFAAGSNSQKEKEV